MALLEFYHQIPCHPLSLNQAIEIFRLDDLIEASKGLRSSGAPLDHVHNRIRKKLNKMKVSPEITDEILMMARTMDRGHGLHAIFETFRSLFPDDILDDAAALYNQWDRGDLGFSLVRGLLYSRKAGPNGGTRLSSKLDPTDKWKRNSDVIGSNGLMNGQWWPNRLCALRDGAHGSSEAGIYGQTERGAFSVVVGKNEYCDHDQGNVRLGPVARELR